MIAVRALYRESKIEFLEAPPPLPQTHVIVVFLEAEGADALLAPYAELVATANWGDQLDADGAQQLVALHEELAPYRTAANQTEFDTGFNSRFGKDETKYTFGGAT